MRPHADLVWLRVAHEVATRSRCVRSQVGCVLVGADGRVAATGYNGPPAGYAPAEPYGRCSAFCPRAGDACETRAADFSDCPSVHAEVNALLYSDRDARTGGTAYLTRDPCWACAQALAASGLARAVWWSPPEVSEREARVVRFLEACGLTVVRLAEVPT